MLSGERVGRASEEICRARLSAVAPIQYTQPPPPPSPPLELPPHFKQHLSQVSNMYACIK